MADLVFISHSSKDKAIADAICHHLERNNIRCWIAPRDITSTDWAGSIMDGLHRSNIFVVIISHNSIPSPEVTKEVTEATRSCQYILPFKVDLELLNDRLQYHLGPCHWLDAVNPPLEDRIGELVQRISHLSEEDAVYMNRDRIRLMEHALYPRGVFLGREQEILRIGEMLEQEHILFLQGMGGIGKSEIAKGYAQTFRNRYDVIIFASYVTNLKDLICELPVDNLSRAEGETQELWYRRKLEAFHILANDRTLLIVDNYDVDIDPCLEEIVATPCHFLITTRNDHSEYPVLQVGPIREYDKVRKLFSSHYGRTLKPQEQATVDEILRLVGCHTITVELIAKQMKASFLKPDKMLSRLRSTGVNLHLKETVNREGERRTSFDYIRQLFTLSGLDDEGRHLLACMCLVPHSGIPVQELQEILGLEDFDAVNELIGKSWLMLDEETDQLQLHPVICDVVREELRPDQESCRDYIHGLWQRIKGCWFFSVEERSALYPLLKQVLTLFPDPVPALLPEYMDFINIPWICGDFDQAKETGQRVYRFTLDRFGGGTKEAGLAAIYLAGAYHNSGDNQNAEIWYKTALEHRKACLPPNAPELPNNLVKIGRSALFRGDLDEAAACYKEAEKIYDYLWQHPETWENTAQAYPPYYGDYVVEEERLKIALGAYREALELCRKSNDIFVKSFGEENPNSAYSYCDMGICYSMLGEYENADRSLQRALELNLRLNGEASIQTFRTREAMADNDLRKGDREKAKADLLEMEMNAEKFFGPEHPLTIKIRKKREES